MLHLTRRSTFLLSEVNSSGAIYTRIQKMSACIYHRNESVGKTSWLELSIECFKIEANFSKFSEIHCELFCIVFFFQSCREPNYVISI